MKVYCNNSSPCFQAGLTKQIRSEINSCDTRKISLELAKMNIPSDFKDNKVIAWCSMKCCELFKSLKLPLPKGIFVEDFTEVRGTHPDYLGFCSVSPDTFYKNKDIVRPEKTLFFNKEPNNGRIPNFWEYIDEIADEQYAENFSPNDFFLYTFLHEFSHVAHEDNKINHLKPISLEFSRAKCANDDFRIQFRARYYLILSKICEYAAVSPNETIACDLANRITENVNKNSLKMKQNFISGSPYRKLSLRERIVGVDVDSKNLDDILRRFWFGRFN